MKRTRKMSAPRLIRKRAAGQSIPLIALMLVVLIAMVGLSVDVGNTFGEEREAVAAANAASIAGMNAYLDKRVGTTNQTVYTAITNTLKANGVDIANDDRRIQAVYLNAQGAPITSTTPDISQDGPLPDDVAYVQVVIDGEVDTFFARVASRDDLPINASAYAGRCPSGAGVYPISVDEELLRDNEFKEVSDPDAYWERISDGGDYDGFTKRRMYVKDGNTPGSFGWLRWQDGTGSTGANANSARELEAALEGFGTLPAGFEEAPWPETDIAKPATYPTKPGELNPGDWVHGSSGWKNSNDTRTIMDGHIGNGTRMILPIYDEVLQGGSNAVFHIVRLGLFVVTDRGQGQGGSGPWFDMIFLGDANRQETACSATPPPADESFDLVGNVAFHPEYAVFPADYRPVQYVVVFDVSGSMNMNFAGQGVVNNQVVQCTNGPPGVIVQDCGNQATNAWPDESERRIYVAKESIRTLIERTNMPGNANYNPALPNDSMALVWYNDKVPTNNVKGFRSDPAAIINDMLNAGKVQNSFYKTAGGTNGAAGLYRAADLLQNAPKNTTDGAGKQYPYKRVVIFITDGVSNYFLDTSKNDLSGGLSGSSTYATGHSCKTTPGVQENAPCQTTAIGGIYDSKNWDRPITQMSNVANDLIKNNAALEVDDAKPEVYVLALSNIHETGLRDGVATSSSYFFPADTLEKDANGLTNVDKIMITIGDRTGGGVCVAQTEPLQVQMPQSYFQSYGGLSYPTVGQVVIKDANTGIQLSAPITADGTGKLSYEFINIPRGLYELAAFIYVKHPLDDPSAEPRVYRDLFNNEERRNSMTVTVDRSGQDIGGTNTIRQDVELKLSGAVCATGTN